MCFGACNQSFCLKIAVVQTIIRNFTFGYGLVPCPKNDIVGKNIKHSLLFRVQPKASETYWK